MLAALRPSEVKAFTVKGVSAGMKQALSRRPLSSTGLPSYTSIRSVSVMPMARISLPMEAS